MNKEELKELLAHAIVNTTFTNVPVGRVKSELRDKVIDVVNNWYQEPVKPVLPKAVADEMEKAKTGNLSLYGYLDHCVCNIDSAAWKWFYSNKDVMDLIDAWNNGYTVEKPKLYNLILGKDGLDYTIAVVKTLQDKSKTLISADVKRCDLTRDRWQFTQTEIDELNNDFYIKNINLNDYKELVADDSED